MHTDNQKLWRGGDSIFKTTVLAKNLQCDYRVGLFAQQNGKVEIEISYGLNGETGICLSILWDDARLTSTHTVIKPCNENSLPWLPLIQRHLRGKT